jgi:hypothetical protein
MKNTTVIRFCCAILFAYLCLPGARAQTATLAKIDITGGHVSPFVSTFTDNRSFGKDPFFPKSKRREIQPMLNTNVVLQPGELPAGMVLKGLSGTKERPLAIINNYTFALGEEAEVRVGHQLFRIRVIEIKERSVIISVNGTPPREITLRQGL